MNQAPTPLDDKVSGLPHDLVDLVHTCLAKAPADRPETADSIVKRLQAVLAAVAQTAPFELSPQSTAPPLPIHASRDGFRYALMGWVVQRWGAATPPAVKRATEALLAIEARVESAAALSESRRHEADAAIADLIERQRRLEDARDRIANALGRHDERVVERTRALMASETALLEHDEELAELVRGLSATLSEDWHLSVAEVERVTGLLETRTEARQEDALARAELSRAAAADVRSAHDLRFQLIELDGSLQLVERDRVTRGAELDAAARAAHDALVAAQATQDNACLRLFVSALRAGARQVD